MRSHIEWVLFLFFAAGSISHHQERFLFHLTCEKTISDLLVSFISSGHQFNFDPGHFFLLSKILRLKFGYNMFLSVELILVTLSNPCEVIENLFFLSQDAVVVSCVLQAKELQEAEVL
jgi:hypothetical protein